MKRILVPLLVLALLCVGVSASAEGNTIKFDGKVNFVFEGETLQTVLERTGVPAEGELTYTSGNTSVATVDSNGVVTGVSKGRTTITAISATEKKTFRTQLTLNVGRKAESVEVNTSKLKVYTADDPVVAGLLKAKEETETEDEAGDRTEDKAEDLPILIVPVKKQVGLQISVLPRDATSRRVKLSCEDETVAITRENSVIGRSVGETVLTIANDLSPEVNCRFRVLVVQPVTRLSPTASNPRVAAGSTLGLAVSVQPEDASIRDITWTSQDERIATVDENGVVTGVKKGNVRIVAAAKDGSNVRANINLRVTQSAEEIVLQKTDLTIDVGRNSLLRAEVLPRSMDDKSLVWTSSDESIAKVDRQGRVTGVSLGTCQIICSSAGTEGISAAANVTVQQPVTKIVFGKAPVVYVNETGVLSWSVEPANASNPRLTFTSGNPRVLTVSEDGTVTGLKRGETYVTAVSTDGSNRRARILVKVHVHATGVKMRRDAAYINAGSYATCTADFSPREATDRRMTWRSDNESIAYAKSENNRVTIYGKTEGTTRIYGTALDGGFETSILVHVGHWDKSLKLTKIDVDTFANLKSFTVKNVSDLNITTVTCEIEFYTYKGADIVVNTKDGTNTVTATYNRTLAPGQSTRWDYWKIKDFKPNEDEVPGIIIVRIVSFQVDHDWIKTIRKDKQPTIKWD